jgi:hypothetical protein
MDCAITVMSLGRSALSLRELAEHVAAVPVRSLTHHFHEALLRYTFDHPEYRNDFALWAHRDLHDARLAEMFGMIDPFELNDPEDIRQALLDVAEDRLSEVSESPRAAPGHEFHFLQAQTVICDTGKAAKDPAELGALIPRLTLGSVFYHFVEARKRPPLRRDDFSVWLGEFGTAYAGLRARLEGITVQLWSLPELRDHIARSFQGADPAGAS